jgi:hypothetical protein
MHPYTRAIKNSGEAEKVEGGGVAVAKKKRVVRRKTGDIARKWFSRERVD